jgi:glyoxylase-like metal-dependent hydrolase (beta-lactamase superfamily II)
MQLYTINTGNFKLDGGAMFGVVPKKLWSRNYPADENNLCTWSLRCLLVVEGDRRILIDTGLGDKQDEKFFGHFHLHGDDSLEKSLNARGFQMGDITDVVHTHLHFDHCGGSIKWNDDKTGLELTFPNATYWASRAQFEWAINPNHREKPSFLKENILPMQESGRLKLIDEEGELFPNFGIKIFNGHTRGQIIPHIKVNRKTVVFMGDLLPSAAHLPLPYIMAYDIDPLLTLEEKKQFFAQAIENDYILFFEHDFYNECCTLIETEKGVNVDRVFTLEDLSGFSE